MATGELLLKKLEARISLKTQPVTLTVALQEIGRRAGVRIGCDPSLHSAVLVVQFRDKPAREAMDRIAEGIGASLEIEKGGLALRPKPIDGDPNDPAKFKVPEEERIPRVESTRVAVELEESVYQFLLQMRVAHTQGSTTYDPRIAARIVDPIKYDPHSITPSYLIGDVTEKLGLNAVVFLSDISLFSLTYARWAVERRLTGWNVIEAVYFMGSTLRKREDWFLCYPVNRATYLENQLDRAAWAEFMRLAVRPGAMGIEQNIKSARKLRTSYFSLARSFARQVRPGFDSINPVHVEVAEFIGSLDSGLLRRAMAGEVSAASLPANINAKFQAMVSSQGLGSPTQTDSVDATPTLDDYKRSRFSITTVSKVGILALNSLDPFGPQARYDFVDRGHFNGFKSARDAAKSMAERSCWQTRLETVRVQLSIPRRNPRSFGTSNYVSDVSARPLNQAELEQVISQLSDG